MNSSPRVQTTTATAAAQSISPSSAQTLSASESQGRPGFRVKIPDHFLASSNSPATTATGGVSEAAAPAVSKPLPVASASTVASSASTATRPPPPVARSRQSRAEQLLRDLDADIERDRRTRSGRRSYSADRAADVAGGPNAKTEESQQRQVLAAASHRFQTPPPMHYYNSGGQQKSASAEESSSSADVQVATAGGSAQRQTIVRIDPQSHDPIRREAVLQQNLPRLSLEESQRLLDRLLLEKETMATELHHLRQRRNADDGNQQQQQQQQRYPTLPEYDPESPMALKKRIVDLEQQISDLQEANETLKLTTPTGAGHRGQQQQLSTISATESRLKAKLDEIIVENEALKNELNRLRQQREQPQTDMAFIRGELDSLRTELDVLRERNYQLERENRRLLETGGSFLSDTYSVSGGFSADNPYRPTTKVEYATHVAGISNNTKISNSRPPRHQHFYQQQQQQQHEFIQHKSDIDRYDRSINRFVADPATYANPTALSAPTVDHRDNQIDRSNRHYGSLGRSGVKQAPFETGGVANLRHSLDRDFMHPSPLPMPQQQQQQQQRLHSREDKAAFYPGQSFSNQRLNGRPASFTSNGGTSDDSDDSAAHFYQDGRGLQPSQTRNQWGAPPPPPPPADAYLQRDAGRRRPDSASQAQHHGSRRRGSSGSHSMESSPIQQRPKHQQQQQQQLFSTAGRLPFAPKQAGDIRSGDLVKFTRCGGRISKGLVHFVGRLPGRSDFYVGVELDQEEGKHDGVYDGRRYFQCKPRKGVFVAFNKLIMCYQLPA